MFLCISLVRKRLQQIQLVKGPNRILLTLEDLTFINPQLSKKVSTIPETLPPISSDGNRARLLTPSWCFSGHDPQKITLEDLSESKSGLEEKSADRSHSVNSMQTTSHETTNVAVYEVGQASCHRTIITYACLGVKVVLAHFDSVLIFWLKCDRVSFKILHSNCC